MSQELKIEMAQVVLPYLRQEQLAYQVDTGPILNMRSLRPLGGGIQSSSELLNVVGDRIQDAMRLRHGGRRAVHLNVLGRSLDGKSTIAGLLAAHALADDSGSLDLYKKVYELDAKVLFMHISWSSVVHAASMLGIMRGGSKGNWTEAQLYILTSAAERWYTYFAKHPEMHCATPFDALFCSADFPAATGYLDNGGILIGQNRFVSGLRTMAPVIGEDAIFVTTSINKSEFRQRLHQREFFHHRENEFPDGIQIQSDRLTYERDRRLSAPPKAAISLRRQAEAVSERFAEDFGRSPYGYGNGDHRLSARVLAQTLRISGYDKSFHFYGVNGEYPGEIDWMDTFLSEHDPLLDKLRTGSSDQVELLRDVAYGLISP